MQEFDFNKTEQVIHATKVNAKSPVSSSKYNVSKIETIKEGKELPHTNELANVAPFLDEKRGY